MRTLSWWFLLRIRSYQQRRVNDDLHDYSERHQANLVLLLASKALPIWYGWRH